MHTVFLPKIVTKPWGREIIIAHTDKFATKILEVNAKECLSLQHHNTKDEVLYLLSGNAWFEIRQLVNNQPSGQYICQVINPGESIHIPPGVVHRLYTSEFSVLIEGSTPELDDVVRWKDAYGR